MRRAALIAALALLGPGEVARAQAPERADDGAPADEIVVLGVRTGALEPAPGASRDLLLVDDYAAERKSLADVLDERPGVFVRRFGGAGDRSEVSIRGSNPQQVVVTLDGVRTNSVLTGGLDLSRLCLPLLESVEITRGAGSTREGSGALGGVVDLTTRGPGAEPATRLEASGGAFDTWQGSLHHADRIGPLDVSVGYCGFTSEGDFDFVQPVLVSDGFARAFDPAQATRLNNDREQHAGTLGLAGEWGPGTLRVSDYFVHSEGGEPGLDGGNGASAGQSTEARSRDLANLAQLQWSGRPPAALGDELTLALHHRFERSAFEDPAIVFAPPIDVTVRLQTAGARGHSRWRHAPFGALLTSDLRADFAHERLRQAGQPGRDRPAAGAALEESLRLLDGRLQLSASARLDWTDGFEPEWLPGVGLVVSPWRWLRLRGQAGRAWRAPSFDELFHPDEGFIRGNPALRPEDAWNADAGVELRLAEAGPLSDVSLGATVFRRETEDSIAFLLVGPDTIQPVNLGRATATGLELSASLRLTRWLRASAQHTALESERDATGRRLPGQPERETHVRVQLGPPELWKLVGELEAVGGILVSEGAERRLPAREVWNASAALDLMALPGAPRGGGVWPDELWLYAALDNLGDEAVRDSIAFPQPGRHASAGFEGRW